MPRRSRRRHRFLFGTLFGGLSLLTITVLALAFHFFSSEPVRAQLARWILPSGAMLPRASLPLALRESVQEARPSIPAPIPFTLDFHSLAAEYPLPDDTPVPGHKMDTPDDRAAIQLPIAAEPTSHAPAARQTTTAPPTPTQTPPPPGRLIIPSLGVVSEVVPVPVIDGQWDISGLGTAVGLLQTTGTRPGDDWGMAFIGHVTVPWPDTGPFADLILLEHEEEVIYRWDGTDYVYEVERIFLVSPQSVETLYQPGGDTIVLATCSSWNYLNRDYAQRLVTRAKLVRREETADVSLAR